MFTTLSTTPWFMVVRWKCIETARGATAHKWHTMGRNFLLGATQVGGGSICELGLPILRSGKEADGRMRKWEGRVLLSLIGTFLSLLWKTWVPFAGNICLDFLPRRRAKQCLDLSIWIYHLFQLCPTISFFPMNILFILLHTFFVPLRSMPTVNISTATFKLDKTAHIWVTQVILLLQTE